MAHYADSFGSDNSTEVAVNIVNPRKDRTYGDADASVHESAGSPKPMDAGWKGGKPTSG